MGRRGDKVRQALAQKAGISLDELRQALSEVPDADTWAADPADATRWTRAGGGYLLSSANGNRMVELHGSTVHGYRPATADTSVVGSPLDGMAVVRSTERPDLAGADPAVVWAALADYLTNPAKTP